MSSSSRQVLRTDMHHERRAASEGLGAGRVGSGAGEVHVSAGKYCGELYGKGSALQTLGVKMAVWNGKAGGRRERVREICVMGVAGRRRGEGGGGGAGRGLRPVAGAREGNARAEEEAVQGLRWGGGRGWAV